MKNQNYKNDYVEVKYNQEYHRYMPTKIEDMKLQLENDWRHIREDVSTLIKLVDRLMNHLEEIKK